MNASRFSLPGFKLVRKADTSTHEVEIGTITVGNETFVVHMLRKANLPFEGKFLVARVFDRNENDCLWEFHKFSFSGLGFLAQADSEPVIALVGPGKDGKVERVIPFSSLTAHKPLDLRRGVALKLAAASYLNLECKLSDSERKLAAHNERKRHEAEEAEKQAAFEARQRAREELISRVLKRGEIEVQTLRGSRTGRPATETEWPSLSNGTYVVLVENYDDETGVLGKAVEAFQIIKEKGRNPRKGFGAIVMESSPSNTTVVAPPKPVDTLIVEIGDGVFEVSLYQSMDEIRTARIGGLNSGTYVTAIEKKQPDGRYEVFSVHTEDIETIGLCTPLA